MQLIVGLLWSWWNARNKANAGEGMRSTDEVIFRVRLLIQKDQKVEAGESMIDARANVQRWAPSPDENASFSRWPCLV